MSRKQPADDKLGEVEFETINHEIDLLLRRLHGKRVCPCCIAQGMMYRGAFLHQEIVGADETVALCLDIADVIGQPDGVEMSETQH